MHPASWYLGMPGLGKGVLSGCLLQPLVGIYLVLQSQEDLNPRGAGEGGSVMQKLRI